MMVLCHCQSRRGKLGAMVHFWVFMWDCFKEAIKISRTTKAAPRFSGVREGHYGWLWVAAVTADLWCELCYNMFGDSPLCSVSLPNPRIAMTD